MDTPVRRHRLILLATVLLGALAPGMTAYASPASTEPQVNLLRMAENLDMNGSPAAARQMYDAYERKHYAELPTIPSAVNLFALDKLDRAWDYFTQIQKMGINTDREYASLWLALLYSKEKGKLASGKDRDFLLPDIFITPSRREIARLYRGELPVENFIKFIRSSSAFSAKDEFTEIVFFTIGYLKYVNKNVDEAKKIMEENKFKLSSYSLERPLMEMGKP